MPIIQIIHFSDLHLQPYKNHDIVVRVFNSALEEWKKINPDRIVFTGDLLHMKTQLSPELLNITNWVLTECAKIAKTILIIGNHDALINNTDRLDALTPIFNALDNPNIVYYKDMGIYNDENISWCVFSQLQNNERPNIESATNFKIGLFHGPIQGLKTDLGFDFDGHAYDLQRFEGLDVLFCGDIHKRAKFDIPNNKFGVMIGSFMQHNFGESVIGHGYGVYNVSTNEYVFNDVFNPRPYLQFKIKSFDDIDAESEKMTNYGDRN